MGIDRNVGQVAIGYYDEGEPKGEIFEVPDLKEPIGKIRRLQRKMSRQVKGSNRRLLTKIELRKTSRHVAIILSFPI